MKSYKEYIKLFENKEELIGKKIEISINGKDCPFVISDIKFRDHRLNDRFFIDISTKYRIPKREFRDVDPYGEEDWNDEQDLYDIRRELGWGEDMKIVIILYDYRYGHDTGDERYGYEIGKVLRIEVIVGHKDSFNWTKFTNDEILLDICRKMGVKFEYEVNIQGKIINVV